MKNFQRKDYNSQSSFEKNISHQMKNEKGKPVSVITNEVSDFFQQFEIQIFENRLFDVILKNCDYLRNIDDQRKEFKQILENLLFDDKENDLSKHQQLFNLIQNLLNNKVSEEQINEIMVQWQSIQRTSLQISQIFESYKLVNLIKLPGMLNIIARVIYYHQSQNQYEFYHSLILEFIKNDQNNSDSLNINKIFENLELIAIHLTTNKQNTLVLEELLNISQLWMKPLLKNKQIIDFLIARHFDVWLSKISEDQSIELKEEIDIFQQIRDQSKLGMINFLEADFIGAIEYLKEIYNQRNDYKIKIIKMIQASAIINNFEQEAGNAMTILSNCVSIIRNQDFSNINLKNSTMNDIQFIESNFNDSRMNNVSLISTQFIESSLQKINWQNLESSYLNILDGNQTLFSLHKSILISMIVRQDMNVPIFNIIFYNLHTGKNVKILHKQSNYGYGKQRLKLSCFGQVLVYFDETEVKSIFWSIQSQKKIRLNKDARRGGKNALSHDCQILAQQNENHINLWRIYKIQHNLQIQAQDKYQKYQIKYSKNNQILILNDNRYSFWDVRSGKEIKTIKTDGKMYKFSPDGYHYAIYQYYMGLILKRINDETNVQLLQGAQNNHVLNLKFSPDGKVFAFQDSKSIQLWTVYDQKILQTFDYEFKQVDQFSSLIKFSSDGQTLAFKYKDHINLWSFNQVKQFIRIEGGFNIRKIKFSQNGEYLVLQDYIFFRLYNLKNSFKLLTLALIPDGLSFSITNSQLGFAFGCQDEKSKTMKIKIVDDMKVISEIDFNKNNFTSFTLSPDFKQIAYCDQKIVCIENIENGEINDVLKFESTDWPDDIIGKNQLKFSPDGQYLIVFMQTSINEWSLQIWEINNQSRIYQIDVISDFSCRDYTCESFEFSNDSQSLAISYIGQIRILNIKTKEFNNLRFEEYYLPQTLAFSSNGQFLACDNYDRSLNNMNKRFRILIFKINNSQTISRLEGHNKKINKIIFLNDNIIASASEDCTIRIWNWQIEQQIQVLNLHQVQINNLSISPDRSMMVSKDCNGTIYLWKNLEIEKQNQPLMTTNCQQEEMTKNQISHQLEKYYYIPYVVLGDSRFRSFNCKLSGSQIYSTEGFNLQNVFQGIENQYLQ